MEYSEENSNNLFLLQHLFAINTILNKKNNAYYHIEAINLPFQNIEFYYIDKELKNE